MEVKQFTTIEKHSPQTFLPIFEYRGYTVFRNQQGHLKKDRNYTDSFGKTMNNTIPLHHALVVKNGVKPYSKRAYETVNLHVSMFGGDDMGTIDLCNFKYTENKIDGFVLQRKNRILQKVENRKQTKMYTYILNNVVVTVTFDADDNHNTNIYVNNKPLRHVKLKTDFNFDDVLKQVYFNTIAKYNIANFDSDFVKKNYFRDIQTFIIDLEVLPIYEYIGMVVEFKGKTHTVFNVWNHANESDFKLFTDNGDIYINVTEVKDLKIISLKSESPMKSLRAVKNKLNFYE